MPDQNTESTDGSGRKLTRRDYLALSVAGGGVAGLASLGAGSQDGIADGNLGIGGGPMSDEMAHARAQLYFEAESELPEPTGSNRVVRITEGGPQFDVDDYVVDNGDSWDLMNFGVGSVNAEVSKTGPEKFGGEELDANYSQYIIGTDDSAGLAIRALNDSDGLGGRANLNFYTGEKYDGLHRHMATVNFTGYNNRLSLYTRNGPPSDTSARVIKRLDVDCDDQNASFNWQSIDQFTVDGSVGGHIKANAMGGYYVNAGDDRFDSIDDAITRAIEQDIKRVIIPPGEHNETLTLSRNSEQNIQLIGTARRGNNQSRIVGDGDHTIEVQSSNVELHNLRIENVSTSGSYHGVLINADDVVINRCTFADASGDLIRVGDDYASIIGNRRIGAADGDSTHFETGTSGGFATRNKNWGAITGETADNEVYRNQ